MSPDAATADTTRRAQILEAALGCFTDKGFSGTTIEDIRDHSGASTGSIYHHFGSKEQLAGELYVEGLRRYQEGFARTLDRHDDAEEMVRALVRYHLRWIAGNRDLASFLLGRRETEVLLASEALVSELNREVFGRAQRALEPHFESGAMRRLPLELFYFVLIGPSQEFGRHWLAGRAETSIRAAERGLADAAWLALAGERSSR